MKVYINGQYFDQDKAVISVFDHGLLYGDGIFEGLRAYSGKVFRLREHMDRLWDSAKGIHLDIPMSKDEMEAAINETLKVNGFTDAYIRLIITRGIGDLGLDSHICANPQVIIISDNLALYPKELYEKGLAIVTVATVRNSNSALSPQIKSLNYLNNIMAKLEGHLAGCPEALMLNSKGEVAECSGDNIFMIKRGVLQTPSVDSCILEGITRNAVLEIAAGLGVPTKETTLTRHDLFTAEECFLTGSGAELIPVVKIDGRVIGDGKPGAMTKKLLEEFHKTVRQ